MNEIIIAMTPNEARQCVDEIKSHVGKARAMLLDLYEREGWRVLGYESWRECVTAEFGQNERTLYAQLQAAQIESNICSALQENDSIPIRHLLPLSPLEPEQQREVWTKVINTTTPEERTGAIIQSIVNEYQNKPHVANNSGINEWYTPPEYIQAARDVMGEIDLDPASSEIANRIVGAKVFYTADDDGLGWAWDGRVWMNPPYSSELIRRFVEKLCYHFETGDVTESIVLVNNATETIWFRNLSNFASAVVFPQTRVKFLDPEGQPGAPLQGQAVLYLGKNPQLFLRKFSRFGWGANIWNP